MSPCVLFQREILQFTTTITKQMKSVQNFFPLKNDVEYLIIHKIVKMNRCRIARTQQQQENDENKLISQSVKQNFVRSN